MVICPDLTVNHFKYPSRVVGPLNKAKLRDNGGLHNPFKKERPAIFTEGPRGIAGVPG